MHRILFLITLLVIIEPALSQKISPRIQEIYVGQDLEDLKAQPARLDLWTRYSEKGFSMSQVSYDSFDYIELSEILLADKSTSISIETFLSEQNNETVNPLRYMWRPATQNQYFHLQNTDWYIVIPSRKDL